LITEIKVKFIDTTDKAMNDKVFNIAKKWEKYASSICFVDVTKYDGPNDNSAGIRITYTEK
jgi:hypothetical protein